MTKVDIADIIREQCSLEKQQILFVIDKFVDEIINGVNAGERIEIRGFGTFSREKRKARSVYSPIARKKLDVPEREIVAFRPSKQTEKVIKGA